MIIYILSAYSLTDHLLCSAELELPKACPECDHKLWKHGKRFRVCETLQMCVRLEIVRMFCANCRKTFSLLPSFLEAGRRFERSVSEQYVVSFGSDESTYRAVAWADDERDDASASIARAFRAVSDTLDDISEKVLQLQEHLLRSGLDLCSEPVSHEVSPQLKKTAISPKVRRRQLLTYLMDSLKRYFGPTERAICFAYRSLCLGFRLPTPHSTQHALF
jgi:hypothetical protein